VLADSTAEATGKHAADCGRTRQPRGLQNRLQGAAEPSWVGSIPIHPRQITPGFSLDYVGVGEGLGGEVPRGVGEGTEDGGPVG